MLFYSLFQSLIGKNLHITVELKHGLQVTGFLSAVDQFLNVKLTNVTTADPHKFPQLVVLRTCFIRGSVIRYIHLSGVPLETQSLQDACRRGYAAEQKKAGAGGDYKSSAPASSGAPAGGGAKST